MYSKYFCETCLVYKIILTLRQTTYFGLNQFESICRRQIECCQMVISVPGKGRKYCEKRRKYWLAPCYVYIHIDNIAPILIPLDTFYYYCI